MCLLCGYYSLITQNTLDNINLEIHLLQGSLKSVVAKKPGEDILFLCI
jgi:hypothetical protein